MTILNEIFANKKSEVARRQQRHSPATARREAETAPAALDFAQALRGHDGPALIAEIKRASPSKGRLVEPCEPLALAELYQANGASAISVLTEGRYFHGSLDDLVRVRQRLPGVPLLRKDFIFDPYQVYESRAAGADALLLIVAGLEPVELADLHALAGALGMQALVEVHTQAELELAIKLKPRLVGINNRDLHTFETSLDTTLRLAPFVPDDLTLVSESGIRNGEDVRKLAQAGVHAILAGEALVTAGDPAAKVRELASTRQPVLPASG